MDFEDWEFLTDDGFIDLNHGDDKGFSGDRTRFDQKDLVDVNYFICPSPNSRRHLKPPPTSSTGSKSDVGKNQDVELAEEIKKVPIIEINLSPAVLEKIRSPNLADPDGASQVVFSKMKETQFVDMKMESQPSNNRGIMPQLGVRTLQFEEKGDADKGEESEQSNCKPAIEQKKGESFADHEIKKKDCCESRGFRIWGWRLTGIGALCSLGMAAGTICIIILGRQKQKQQNQKLRFQIYTDDKRIKDVVQHATRLNQALSAARGVPVNRAHITFGGYYDGL